MTKLTPVLVVWDDAQSTADLSWEKHDAESLSAAKVQTVGFLLREDSTGVELVMSYHADEMAGRWFIPRGCIVSITPV